MMKRGLLVSYLLAAIGGLLATSAAQADTYFPFVRVTCVPKASYAAIETFGVYNTDPDARTALRAEGLQELGAVAQEPIICELPQGMLRVEVVDYHPPQLEGMCSQVDDGNLRVSLAEREIAFAKGTHGGCTGFRRHDIRITEYGVQHCVLRFTHAQMVGPGDFTAIATECNSAWLP